MPNPLVIMGFDFGMRWIGVAIGQSITQTAQPLEVLQAQSGVPDWNKIQFLIKEWRPQALLIGIPLKMDGTEQPITQEAKKFADKLAELFQLPVYHVDERLTTKEVKRIMFEKYGAKGLNQRLDAFAAAVMIETWLRE